MGCVSGGIRTLNNGPAFEVRYRNSVKQPKWWSKMA